MISLKGRKPNILVVGDLMVDHYLWGSCEKISPEAPVQIVKVSSENILLGGAGNVVRNLTTFGATVDVISVIGECENSNQIINLLNAIGVNSEYLIRETNRIASKKSRIVASQQQVVRFDKESNEEIDSTSEIKILRLYKKIINNYDCVLFSDYGKGVLKNELTQSLIQIANINKKKVLVDPKGSNFSKYKGAYLLTPNRKEASKATNIEINSQENLEKAITSLKSLCDLEVSLITLSEDGIALLSDSLTIHPTSAKEVYDVTGAGDTILASLGFALGCDYNINDAVKFANIAAGIVVGKIGSSTASLDEIDNHEKNLYLSNESQIKSLDEISNIADNHRAKGEKIIFTNGCFDILHSGHVKYLEESKKLGDILIVGLNSNNSVSLLKGQNRPINDEIDRAKIISSLKPVDYVVIFNEETPFNLIKSINPNVLVKGGDYIGKKIVGADVVEEVKIIDLIEGRSTSKTIDKIKRVE